MGTHPIFESDFDCLTEKIHKQKCPPQKIWPLRSKPERQWMISSLLVMAARTAPKPRVARNSRQMRTRRARQLAPSSRAKMRARRRPSRTLFQQSKKNLFPKFNFNFFPLSSHCISLHKRLDLATLAQVQF